MANEAVIVELTGDGGDVVEYDVLDTQAIEKGTLCIKVDARKASGSSGSGEAFAGIASTEKEASDGSTTLGLYTRGVFDLYADGAIPVGAQVAMSGANKIRAAVTGEDLSGAVIGRALETATAAETIQVAIGAI